jgi:hypothetical protein
MCHCFRHCPKAQHELSCPLVRRKLLSGKLFALASIASTTLFIGKLHIIFLHCRLVVGLSDAGMSATRAQKHWLANTLHHLSVVLLQVLSLQSQIHWLTEQNTQLHTAAQQAAADAAAAAPHPAACDRDAALVAASSSAAAAVEKVQERAAELEAELRRSKRAELKLQALLFRCVRPWLGPSGAPTPPALPRTLGGPSCGLLGNEVVGSQNHPTPTRHCC